MHNVLRVRAMIHFPLVFVILTEGVPDVVTGFFPVSILHSSFSFLKQELSFILYFIFKNTSIKLHPSALENCMWTSLIGKDELFPFHGLRGSSFDV